ncbi:MAG TPA: GldG family protein, partial [Membranihabitans sp.]|nr:GldG family protein [Membranihabitans sp.]
MKRNIILTRIVLVAGIVLFVNLLSEMWYARLDFTADKQYTLSQATRDILRDLDDVITVTAYFTKNLPPQLVKARRDFEDLLVEYETRSQGSIVYRFVNPNESDAGEQEAQQKGIRPVVVNVTQKDQASQMRAYMGAVLEMGDKSEVIPLIQPGAGVEYALTTAIKKMSVEEKPKVAFILGHGEAGVAEMAQVVQELSVLYDPEDYTMSDTMDIPHYYR